MTSLHTALLTWLTVHCSLAQESKVLINKLEKGMFYKVLRKGGKFGWGDFLRHQGLHNAPGKSVEILNGKKKRD